ncbi:FAD-binding oxidoreductase [Rhizobium laguerreae]|nr:FAD-binding oxidoreductase [Rhizobium laguerreae]MBY3282055.1 FAD-binding oxidoreductase [Rhizobium laguerreae]MBY3293345.1 FAD-binding oxidoreductase [Rhizobium laguerreae]
MMEKFDVVVTGAGLFGTFTAFFLRRRSLNVALVDSGFVGAQSSGANFGNLRLQGRAALQYPLSLQAQLFWERFDTEIGESCEYDRTGHLYIARTQKGLEKLFGYAEASRCNGLEIEVVDRADLKSRFPFLSPDIAAASYSARCAVANPRLATPAVARAFLRDGGRLFEGQRVSEIVPNSGSFTLRTMEGRHFTATKVVNAAGGWANSLAKTFGEEVPMFSAGPPQFVTEPLPYMLRPIVQAVEGDVIVRQIARGNIIFAGYPRTRSQADGEHTYVPPQKIVQGMASLASVIPSFANAEVIRNWSGVEGYLPDMLPVVGPSQTVPGLFHAFGGSGGGFQVAPAVGDCLAALVADEQPACDLHPYRIDRFNAQLETSEKITTEFD